MVRPDCGATVTFTGTARDHAPGRPGVHRLEYEAYDGPARRPPAGARRRGCAPAGPPSGGSPSCTAPGWSSIGDAAVVVAVSSPHRAEAFEAARFAIDELKRTVPIWKREAWDGGESWGLEAQHLTEVALAVTSAIVFLLIVVVVCGDRRARALVQHREPSTLESGIDAFQREMDALAPPVDDPEPKLRRAKRPTRPGPAAADEGR